MTQNTAMDYSETVEREAVEKLCKEFAKFMFNNEWYKINDDHFNAVKYTINYQVQLMLKESDGGKA